MTAPDTRPNPYVGPRSFQTGEKLYGRDVEIRQLTDLLISERIALLHSPSGAGKSSLIRAGLAPCLEEEGFELLPVVRVNLEPPAGLKSQAGFNRFVYSTLISMAEEDPGITPEQLSGMTIAGYLKQRLERDSVDGKGRPGDGGPAVQQAVIFDQFEEVLNVDPTNREAKQAFFRQLGDALDDPQLWALFAIREDFLAALDPYLRPIPTRFKNTYRLDLLGIDAAQQAIVRPARDCGVEFQAATARRLIDDLRRVKIQQPDGSVEEQLGPYVEPLQLQVVCFRLWEKLAPGDQEIDDADLTALGDVNQSLSDYYGQRVAAAAKESSAGGANGVSERAIREWFERQLITEGGMRGQVLMGQGLDPGVVQILENAHLVRGEKRGGATWYELTHDRLVQPIRQNNAAWFQANLNLVQRQAGLWDQRGRPEGVLLRGAPLAEAEAWAAGHASALTPAERDFLTACRKEALGAKRLRQRTQAVMVLGVLALVAAFAAVFFAIRAEGQKNDAMAQKAIAVTEQARAETQASIAEQQKAAAEQQRANALTAQQAAKNEEAKALASKSEAERQGSISTLFQLYTQSSNFVTRQPDLALLLSLELNKIATMPGLEDYRSKAYENLASVVFQQDDRLYRILRGHTGGVESIAVTPDGKLLASAGLDGQVLLWDLQTGAQLKPPPIERTRTGYVYSVVFSTDGQLLAFGRDDGKVFIWSVAKSAWIWNGVQAHDHRADQVAFSPDGTRLATTSCGDYNADSSTCKAGEIKIWKISDQSAFTIHAHKDWIKELLFSPDGQTLFSNSADELLFWNTATGESAGRPGVVASAITITPDGKQLAYWSKDGTIGFIDTTSKLILPRFILPLKPIPFPVTPGEPGTRAQPSQPVITNRLPLLESPSNTAPESAAPQPAGTSGKAASETNPLALASVFEFDPTGKRLAAGGADERIHILDANTGEELVRPLAGHTDKITTIRFFGPGGRYLVSAGYDSRILIWDLEAQNRQTRTIQGLDGVWYVVPSPDERWMATNDPNKEPKNGIRIWDLGSLSELKVLEGPYYARLEVSPDGKWLAAGGRAADNQLGDVRLWRMPEGQLVFSSTDHPGGVTDIAFSPNSQFLFSIGGNQIIIWDTQSGKKVNQAPFRVGSGSFVAFNRDGTQIAIAYGLAVQVFTFPDLNPVGPRIPHEDPNHQPEPAFTLAFSQDGKLLAVGGGDKTGTAKTIRVWNLETREQVTPLLVGHTASIGRLLFSADNTFLASLGFDGTIKLWDLASRDVAVPILNEAVPDANNMLFTPDGSELHVYGDKGSINTWKIGGDYLKSVACRIANRNLTEAEWQLYVSATAPIEKVCP